MLVVVAVAVVAGGVVGGDLEVQGCTVVDRVADGGRCGGVGRPLRVAGRGGDSR